MLDHISPYKQGAPDSLEPMSSVLHMQCNCFSPCALFRNPLRRIAIESVGQQSRSGSWCMLRAALDQFPSQPRHDQRSALPPVARSPLYYSAPLNQLLLPASLVSRLPPYDRLEHVVDSRHRMQEGKQAPLQGHRNKYRIPCVLEAAYPRYSAGARQVTASKIHTGRLFRS